MKVLVVGGGGREDTLVWKILQSPLVEEVYCAPGNGGTAERAAINLPDIKANDINTLLKFALKKKMLFSSFRLIVFCYRLHLNLIHLRHMLFYT